MKKILPILIILALAWGIYHFVWNRDSGADDPSRPVLYYGESCPHCKIVEEYIKKDGVERKLKLKMKEVYNNQTNRSELMKRAQICGIADQGAAVPLLWNGNGCVIGDQDIIKYLKKMLNEK